MFFVGFLAFGQATDPVSDAGFIALVLSFITTAKGLPLVAAILGGVQLIVSFFKTPYGSKLFSKLSAQAKFFVANGLTIVVGYLTLVTSGESTGSAILKTLMLPLAQEFLYQLYKLFFKKKA